MTAAMGGILVGSLLISVVSEPVCRNIIAILMLLFAAFYTWSRRVGIPPQSLARYAWPAGWTAGITSTLAHLGGPPIVAYLMAAGLDPRTFVGTSAVFFAAINVLKIPGYVFADLVDIDLVGSTAWAWVMIPIGVLLGRTMIDRINQAWFERLTLALLTVGAMVLLLT